MNRRTFVQSLIAFFTLTSRDPTRPTAPVIVYGKQFAERVETAGTTIYRKCTFHDGVVLKHDGSAVVDSEFYGAGAMVEGADGCRITNCHFTTTRGFTVLGSGVSNNGPTIRMFAEDGYGRRHEIGV